MAGIEKKVDWGLDKVLQQIKKVHKKMDGPITLIGAWNAPYLWIIGRGTMKKLS